MLIARPFRQGASRLFGERFLTALLVVALLLCHGALGGLHQVSAKPAVPEQAHHVSADEAMSPQEHQGGHQGSHPLSSSDYAAALSVVLLLGAVLVLVLSGGLTRRPELRILERVLPPPGFRPIRGPTAPLLQVFRL